MESACARETTQAGLQPGVSYKTSLSHCSGGNRGLMLPPLAQCTILVNMNNICKETPLI